GVRHCDLCVCHPQHVATGSGQTPSSGRHPCEDTAGISGGSDVPCVSRNLAALGPTHGTESSGHSGLLWLLCRCCGGDASFRISHGSSRLAGLLLLLR
ncbi:hypothetical protein CDAR_80451, partial [Caerostris darwini]